MTKRVIRRGCPEWPSKLDDLGPHLPPDRLYVEGLPLVVGDRTIAVVGARHPSAAGVEAARELTTGLAQAGFGIVSGLAVGIDSVAHRAALEVGGYTIAVLGCGLDVDYPKRNKKLKELIGQRGTLVTEYPDGTEPYASHFPERNRILAGLAKGVLFVEGTSRSGGLITARIALDAQRDVYAVPGSIRNPLAWAPNELIRTSQAALVTEVKHICDEVAPSLVWQPTLEHGVAAPAALDEPERQLLAFLDDSPVPREDIRRQSGLTEGEASLALARLEVRGLALRRTGGYVITDAGARARRAEVAAATAPG